VINYCQGKGIKFAIGADLDKAVVRGIREIREEDWKPYQNGYIAETVHCMNGTDEAFRLVVIRRPYQGKLFAEAEVSEKEEVEEVVGWYNQRGECSENRIKELKIGFGMESLPAAGRDALWGVWS